MGAIRRAGLRANVGRMSRDSLDVVRRVLMDKLQTVISDGGVTAGHRYPAKKSATVIDAMSAALRSGIKIIYS